MADNEKILKSVAAWMAESENDKKAYETQWARNKKLMKGIPLEDKSTRSDVRQRNKTYFRKIWSMGMRFLAAIYNAFLRDYRSFRVNPVDTMDDPRKAAVHQKLMEYRIRQMYRKDDLFQRHIWAYQDIWENGFCGNKLSWYYNDDTKADRPRLTSYPPEQTFLDFTADTKRNMRYYFFKNYMTMDEMKGIGYENLGEAEMVGVISNEVRSVRHSGTIDPLQNPGNKEYAAAGRYAEGNETDLASKDLYESWECFYREGGKWKFCVTHKNKAFAKKPIDSPYGDTMTLIMGQCLTEPHKLIGEGFPQSLEGPQESYNFNLNMRKDNVALALNKPSIVARYSNVDLNALLNRGPGKMVLADDPDAVREMDIQDVTQSSYAEAQADMGMMEDISGITAAIQGISSSDTATESQINLSQGSAKLDLYTALIGETYMKDFISTLGEFIQRFETDETAFRVAQQELQIATGIDHSDVYSLDYEADYEIEVGLNVGREQELRQSMLILDRGAMFNQQVIGLMQTGVQPPEGFKLFNGLALFEDIMKSLGKKDFSRYMITMGPPPPQQGGPGMPVDNGGMMGYAAGQPGDMANMMPQNELQAGGGGGF